jgi:hypothetical protein
MILLASGNTLAKQYGSEPWFGQLLCPRSRNRIIAARYAVDNSAFAGKIGEVPDGDGWRTRFTFDVDAYWRMCFQLAERVRAGEVARPLFLTVPDYPMDARRTRGYWYRAAGPLSCLRLPLAYVIQDGQQDVDVPYDEAACIFIGGSTEFKLSPRVRATVAYAKRLGLWVHMGRVNSAKRVRYAMEIGCDSVDGSGFARYPDRMLPSFTSVAVPAPPVAA